MNIASDHKEITITSNPEQGFKYLHVVIYKKDESNMYEVTDSVSEFRLEEDGYYTISEYKITEDTDVNIDDYLNQSTDEKVDILVLCELEECLNYLNKQIIYELMSGKCLKDIKLREDRDLKFLHYCGLKYLGETNHFNEAQRILLEIYPCNCGCLK